MRKQIKLFAESPTGVAGGMRLELKKFDSRAHDLNHISTHHAALLLVLFTESILELVEYICNCFFKINHIRMPLQCAWVQDFESSTFAKHVWIECVRRVLRVKWLIFNFICIFLKLHVHSFKLWIATGILNCLPNAILSWDKHSFSTSSVLRTTFYNNHAIGSNSQYLRK